jgi:hypothetical protein
MILKIIESSSLPKKHWYVDNVERILVVKKPYCTGDYAEVPDKYDFIVHGSDTKEELFLNGETIVELYIRNSDRAIATNCAVQLLNDSGKVLEEIF